jgi:hypothetical protein
MPKSGQNCSTGAGDPTPVVGPRVDSARFLRNLPEIVDMPRDLLGKHIARLLALHPAIAPAFADRRLSDMAEEAKQQLLAEINQRLGIQPLRESSK